MSSQKIRGITRRDLLTKGSAAAVLGLLGASGALAQSGSQGGEGRNQAVRTRGGATSRRRLDVPGFAHGDAEVNGVRLHYVTAGDGEEAVVLSPGFPFTWYHWRYIIPALAERYTVIAYDLRGIGDSEKPPGGYDMFTQVEDVRGLVRSLGYEHVFFVGHDLGAPIGYFYAARYPEEVRRLVVLDSLIYGLPGYDEFLQSAAEPWWFAFHALPELPEALVAGQERAYLSWFYDNLSYESRGVTEDALGEYVAKYSVPGGMTGGFAHYRAFPEATEQGREVSASTRLTVPTLALGGESVTGTVLLEQLRPVADDVQGGSIPRCGHIIAEERPVYLTDQLLNFFGQESAATPRRATLRAV